MLCMRYNRTASSYYTTAPQKQSSRYRRLLLVQIARRGDDTFLLCGLARPPRPRNQCEMAFYARKCTDEELTEAVRGIW
ncbi:hypothetical protein J6590_020207 [Homalodisca vitripennis]|nr:hypothetical protein J6590_020207 [Homalodisca vitripennis]